MLKDRRFIIVLCIILFVLLVFLMFIERQSPEGGAELLRSLLGR